MYTVYFYSLLQRVYPVMLFLVAHLPLMGLSYKNSHIRILKKSQTGSPKTKSREVIVQRVFLNSPKRRKTSLAWLLLVMAF